MSPSDKVGRRHRLAIGLTALTGAAALALAAPVPASAQSDPATYTLRGYLRDHRGRYRTIDVPGAAATSPGAINDRGQVAGTYLVGTDPGDPNAVNHGFLRDRRGRVTTIDHPRAGASGTATYGLDDRGRTVGAYTSSAG